MFPAGGMFSEQFAVSLSGVLSTNAAVGVQRDFIASLWAVMPPLCVLSLAKTQPPLFGCRAFNRNCDRAAVKTSC